MKRIQKEELYDYLSQFLKAKGIEMKDGSYPAAIQKGCSFLADAINLSQKGITRARVEIDKNLDRMRQVIHEKTAPKPAARQAARPKSARPPKLQAQQRKRKSSKR
ncbi:MAG TPA: hypothetical protein P5205_09200 [Candidatus Paceibacterota bacterium]|nr:hypothetical protein [Verrucomicrobiota bacterium]HSA10532.1 hypothetical protein [Candidatus Paceibacterota bacterium]